MPDKANADVVLSFPAALTRPDPRYLAAVLACAACVTTRQEGEDMRKRIDALEKTVKDQGESSAADRQKLLNEEKRLQDALDTLNRAARKSGADLAVDLE